MGKVEREMIGIVITAVVAVYTLMVLLFVEDSDLALILDIFAMWTLALITLLYDIWRVM